MRVIYSTGAKFGGGGIGTTAYYTVRSLFQQGLLQRLLCGASAPTDIPGDKIRALGIASRALRKAASFDTTRWLWYLESLIFDAWASRHLEPADLFHVWSNYGLTSLRRARAMGMVSIVERASTHPAFYLRLFKEEYRRWGLTFRAPGAALRRIVAEMGAADYVLIPSDFVRRTFLAEGFPEERLLQLPFGVDTARFCPAEQPSFHPFRVLFVGQIGIGKGVPYLLEAWRKLGWRDAELWLVGRVDPSSAPILGRWNGLPGVRYVPYTPDPVALYQQSDVFALPTLQEGSALVTYEALACGLPLVTTPNAGSVARDNVEGFIIPIRDVDSLASRLERLRADEPLRQEMRQAARRRAEAFTWKRYGEELCRKLATIGKRG